MMSLINQMHNSGGGGREGKGVGGGQEKRGPPRQHLFPREGKIASAGLGAALPPQTPLWTKAFVVIMKCNFSGALLSTIMHVSVKINCTAYLRRSAE